MKFIHSQSNIEGQVTLGAGVSVWPFASIRGDEGEISIGDNTSVQDNVTIHGTVTIGNNVTIGHGAVIHNAQIGNNVVIGMNSTVLDGTKIGDWCIIAAGSVVAPKSIIESESLVMGTPGKVTRKLDKKDKAFIESAYKNYLDKIKNTQS